MGTDLFLTERSLVQAADLFEWTRGRRRQWYCGGRESLSEGREIPKSLVLGGAKMPQQLEAKKRGWTLQVHLELRVNTRHGLHQHYSEMRSHVSLLPRRSESS